LPSKGWSFFSPDGSAKFVYSQAAFAIATTNRFTTPQTLQSSIDYDNISMTLRSMTSRTISERKAGLKPLRARGWLAMTIPSCQHSAEVQLIDCGRGQHVDPTMLTSPKKSDGRLTCQTGVGGTVESGERRDACLASPRGGGYFPFAHSAALRLCVKSVFPDGAIGLSTR